MPLIEPYLLDAGLDHSIALWERAECYRFYVTQRRRFCTLMHLLDLWLRAPVCGECIQPDPDYLGGLSDITRSGWQSDIILSVGLGALKRTKAAPEGPALRLAVQEV